MAVFGSSSSSICGSVLQSVNWMIIIVIVLIIDDGHGDDDNEVGTDRNWLKARVYFLQTNSCLLPTMRLVVLRVCVTWTVG